MSLIYICYAVTAKYSVQEWLRIKRPGGFDGNYLVRCGDAEEYLTLAIDGATANAQPEGGDASQANTASHSTPKPVSMLLQNK